MWRGADEAPRATRPEVAEEVGAEEGEQPPPPIDVPTGHSHALRVVVLGDGIDVLGAVTATPSDVTAASLPRGPPVVAPFDNAIDLLGVGLPDVTGPQLTGHAVEAEAPGVAQAVRPDLRAALPADEGVVGRDGVWLSGVDVDSQDLPQEGVEALGVVVRIRAQLPVAKADVEVPIGSEQDVAAVVVRPRLRELDEDLPGAAVEGAVTVEAIAEDMGQLLALTPHGVGQEHRFYWSKAALSPLSLAGNCDNLESR